MSIRYEWMHLPGIEFLPPNSDASTGAPADVHTEQEDLVEVGALLLSADSVTVVTGEADDLAKWAVDALAAAVTGGDLHLYEVCAICHLFVEPNSSYDMAEDNSNIARYSHLCNDDYPTDGALDASHEPHPSGVSLPLAVWQKYGPAHMRAMFGRS